MNNRQETLKRKIRVLCYGDSNTWGYIPNGNHSRYDGNTRWTCLLQKKLGAGYEIIEEGLCSRTLCSGDLEIEDKNKNGFLSLKPCMDKHGEFDLLILMLGVNDFKRCYNNSIQDIYGFYEKYIEVLKNYRTKENGEPIKFFILSGIRPTFGSDDKVFDTLSRWDHVDECMRLEHSDVYVRIPSKIDDLGDNLHFTEQGHKRIANICYDKIKSMNLERKE